MRLASVKRLLNRHFDIEGGVGHVYHTDTRLAAVFMSNCLLVVVTSHGYDVSCPLFSGS